MRMNLRNKTGHDRKFHLLSLLALLDLCSIAISLRIGPIDIPFHEIFSAIFIRGGVESALRDPLLSSIILDIRLPRVLLAALSGGALSIAGVLFQSLLRNILADPYILGVSSGAVVGALVSMITGFNTVFFAASTVCAFFGALLVIVLVYLFGARLASNESSALLLSGVMVGAFLGAVTLILLALMVDPLRNATFWLLGYFGGATTYEVALTSIVVAIGMAILLPLAPSINALALGEQQAVHLGVSRRRTAGVLYVVGSLFTALIVSLVGSIGFVGLIVPHFARRIFGSDHRTLIPGAFFLGVAFLVISDLLARVAFYPVELPVGAITAALGAPLVVYVVRKARQM